MGPVGREVVGFAGESVESDGLVVGSAIVLDSCPVSVTASVIVVEGEEASVTIVSFAPEPDSPPAQPARTSERITTTRRDRCISSEQAAIARRLRRRKFV